MYPGCGLGECIYHQEGLPAHSHLGSKFDANHVGMCVSTILVVEILARGDRDGRHAVSSLPLAIRGTLSKRHGRTKYMMTRSPSSMCGRECSMVRWPSMLLKFQIKEGGLALDDMRAATTVIDG